MGNCFPKDFACGELRPLSEVRLERDGVVAVLTLAAPERRNALTPGMVDELLAACEEIDSDPGVGAVEMVAATAHNQVTTATTPTQPRCRTSSSASVARALVRL